MASDSGKWKTIADFRQKRQYLKTQLFDLQWIDFLAQNWILPYQTNNSKLKNSKPWKLKSKSIKQSPTHCLYFL